MKKNALQVSVALLLCAGLLSAAAGCGGSTPSSSAPSAAPPASSASAPGSESAPAAEPVSNEPISITYWTPMNNNSATSITDYGQMQMYEIMEEKTNVRITFKHPPVGQEKEQFNLMIASKDLPDVIEYGFGSNFFPGGAQKAVDDGYILRLNDLIDAHAPAYKAVLQSDPAVDKQSKTDNGTIYAFHAIGTEPNSTQAGPMMRADWLADVNLPAPETVEEWEVVLTAFKDQKNAAAALTGVLGDFSDNGFLSGAFNVKPGTMLRDGKVIYGSILPEFKEYLSLLNSWYAKGLLDPDFAANDSKLKNANMTSGKSGVSYGFNGSGINTYLSTMEGKDDKYDIVATQYPVQNKGDEPSFLHRAWQVRVDGALAITTKCQYPERIAQWADYFYTEEGTRLKNFGVEGEHYTMVDGKPIYTDFILKNPDGLTTVQAAAKVCRGTTPSPGPILSRDPLDPNFRQQQINAIAVWNKYNANTDKALIPPLSYLDSESEEIATITTMTKSYYDEMFIKFVVGSEPLENFDRYVQELENMGVQRLIEINQAAYERYLER